MYNCSVAHSCVVLDPYLAGKSTPAKAISTGFFGSLLGYSLVWDGYDCNPAECVGFMGTHRHGEGSSFPQKAGK